VDISAELGKLARNLLWTWRPQVASLFRDLDSKLWREVNHNPVAFLAESSPRALATRAAELALETRISHALRRLNEYLGSTRTWGQTFAGPLRAAPIAYLSAEFALHEALPIYSGGLGVLAGDYLKSASDLGVPMVGVGLFYAQGYFHQRLDPSGWQEEEYLRTDVEHIPLERVCDGGGAPVLVSVETRSGKIWTGLWRARVGRNSLVLLDSDVDQNAPASRELTGRLYGGDEGTRVRQELILGVGGLRALDALGIRPGVLHLNEGHSAFSILERARQEMARDAIDFQTALRRVSATTVFTTHTPVAAGHDRFGGELLEEVIGPLREQLGLSLHDLMGLGRVAPDDATEPFCMTVLGIKGGRSTNAVSALHGQTSRRMWKGLWPSRREPEVPIGHITNGVHVSSWLAPAMAQLYERSLGADWQRQSWQPQTWAPVAEIDPVELWETHQILKARLVSYVQRSVCLQEARLQGEPEVCRMTTERLDPEVLTIGFARRFATYKRSDLILREEGRLERLVTDRERPIQIIVAGKAHPRDEPGKHAIQRIFRMSRDARFLGRIAFLEDYDFNVARHLVQGVDLWLNNPVRPLEACGTSGMKALFNGALNLSILDGWWAEAYDGSNGFAIGSGGEHSCRDEQDRRDGEALYDALEREVIPLYYERDAWGVPLRWMQRVKNALRSLAWRFCADRMVLQYADECYLPAVGLVASRRPGG
jgi:starch phosphorylase